LKPTPPASQICRRATGQISAKIRAQEIKDMIDITKIDFSILDRSEVLLFLFHPRPEPTVPPFRRTKSEAMITVEKDVMITVEKDVIIGARFHMAEKSGANILFFHGNGEIVADYDELAGVYNQMGINFLAVDYRGYGRSTGKPTVTAMMRDCHLIFEFALELAAAYKRLIGGLIVESGFAHAGPLLELIGIDLAAVGFREEKGFRNIDKITCFDKPALIIHAEFDHIIPFAEGQALYAACPSPDKQFLKVHGANHNDIFMRGQHEYLRAVKEFAALVKERHRNQLIK